MPQRVVLAYPGGLDTSGATFAQPVATGFVELWGCPARSRPCGTPRPRADGRPDRLRSPPGSGRARAEISRRQITRTGPWGPAQERTVVAAEEQAQAGDTSRAHADQAVGGPVRVQPRRGAGPAVGQRPVRLAAGPLRPARLAGPHPGPAPGRAAGRRRGQPPAGRAGRPGRGLPRRPVPAHGRGRGRAHRAGARPARAGRRARRQAAGRPQPQRPDRHRPAAVPARSRPAGGLAAGRAGDRAARPGRGAHRTPRPPG